MRDIEVHLDEFPFESFALDQTLTCCDLTTSPYGSGSV